MSIGEKNTSPRESLDVGCNVLRVPIQADNPVIQVINRNQEDVGMLSIISRELSLENPDQQTEKKEPSKTHPTVLPACGPS